MMRRRLHRAFAEERLRLALHQVGDRFAEAGDGAGGAIRSRANPAAS